MCRARGFKKPHKVGQGTYRKALSRPQGSGRLFWCSVLPLGYPKSSVFDRLSLLQLPEYNTKSHIPQFAGPQDGIQRQVRQKEEEAEEQSLE